MSKKNHDYNKLSIPEIRKDAIAKIDNIRGVVDLDDPGFIEILPEDEVTESRHTCYKRPIYLLCSIRAKREMHSFSAIVNMYVLFGMKYEEMMEEAKNGNHDGRK